LIRIGRVRVEIITENNVIGFDDTFDQEMNIICSEKNTSGKSSIISSVYYGLGLEEIIGGRGHSVLSSAFKTKVESDGELDVLESKVFLEISNGSEDVTILRAAKMENRKSNLMTIFYSKMDRIHDKETISEDMYVHSQNSATSNKGFFTFLEAFLGLDLPSVPSTDDKERKLYLQLIFSSMLIEQKRGWSDLFSGMPHFGIREPKKRVIEYLLNMDTLKNEKLRHRLRIKESRIVEKWKQVFLETDKNLRNMGLMLKGVNENVEILEDSDQLIKVIYQDDDRTLTLDEYIELKRNELQSLIKVKPKDIDNFHELKKELRQIEEDVIEHEEKIKQLKININNERSSLDRLLNSLNLIQTDITNNQDAKKLRNLGSKEGFNSFKDICPTCNQPISDTLLVSQNVADVMSIDDNIKHLKSQEKLFEFAIEQKKTNIKNIENNISILENTVSKLYQLSRVTRNDIFAIDGSVSENTIYKKVELNKTIEELEKVKTDIEETKEEFKQLSDDWKQYLADLNKLPENKFTSLDERKIKSLRDNFVSNLKVFGYRSSSDINKVMISKDTYMPTIENFDLKFDSSASDHIRRIWAFTIALVQTSNDLNGNHPGILIFDEPGQHSIVVEDMEAFLDCLITLAAKTQVIVGITIKETDTRELIFKKIAEGCKGIIIKDRAFNKLS
jgi:seryl-tRNA synthetase